MRGRRSRGEEDRGTSNDVRRIALKIDLFGLRLRKQRSPWIRTDKRISKDKPNGTKGQTKEQGRTGRTRTGEMVQANANEYLVEHKLRD